MASTTDDLITQSATQLAQLIRDRRVSSREVVEAHLARIDERNGELNAVRVVLAEQALEAADAADAATPSGPLHGVPITVKENVDVAGTATTHGVAAFAEAITPTDAPSVDSLRKAGAIPIGRTNMPDFALRWHTESGIAGATINPHDPTLTPGGSSGGEAVAIATGMSPLGVGEDLGGSLRWPAQCCGIVSIRPTQGRVPNATAVGATEQPLSLQLMDVIGPMARHTADLRMALELMSAPSHRDPFHVPAPLAGPPAPKRVSLVLDPLNEGVDPAIVTSLERAAKALAEAGYEVEEAEPPALADAVELWAALLVTDMRGMWPLIEPITSPGGRTFVGHVFEGTPPLDLAEYAQALIGRQRVARAWAEHQHERPLILGPISTQPPFAVGADVESAESAMGIFRSLRLTVAVNLLGLPAAAVGGVQVIGPRYREDLCLDAAAAIERAG